MKLLSPLGPQGEMNRDRVLVISRHRILDRRQDSVAAESKNKDSNRVPMTEVGNDSYNRK